MPANSDGPRTRTVQAVVTAAEYEAIQAVAVREERTISSVVRLMLKKGLSQGPKPASKPARRAKP